MRIRKAKDTSGVGWLVEQFQKHLHIPDPLPLYVFFGAVAANMIEGDPVWPMIIGPPSSGKSELLSSALGLPGMHECARISGDAAFLSGTAKKDRSKEATGGILRRVGFHGGIVMNDFTSVLTLPKDKLDAVLSVFRECYIGRWTRDIGSEGGRTLSWEGKVACFGGVTGAIDNQHEASASLGERWIYFRMPESDGWERSRRAMNKRGSGWREELRDVVKAFFGGLDLEFGKLEKRRELTDKEQVRLHRFAVITATCRSAIIRDKFSREIIAAKESEAETRLVVALGQLLLGMEAIGVEEDDRWRGIGTVALDSMPKLRRVVIDEIRAGKVSHVAVTYESLAKAMGCSKTTSMRTVEDLEVYGVVEKGPGLDGKVFEVRFTEQMAEEFRKAWG